MTTKGLSYGLKIRCYENPICLVLCLHCFKPLLDQLGGWGKILSANVYPVKDEMGHRVCDVCSQSMRIDQRSGIERRLYNYAVHIPERRTIIRRKSSSI